LNLFEYRDKLTVQEAEPIEQFRELRDELELFALGSYLAQTVSLVAQEDAPNPELLSLILNALYALAKLRKPQTLVKAAYELRLACLAGFEPELEACPICGSASPDRFDLSRGTAVCAGCHPDDAGLRLPITPGVLDAMRYICWCDGKKLFSFRLEGENLKTLSSVTEAYLMMQLEHSFSTLDFYKSLLQYGDII
jgi:DNA repair protein RecO (recombination protein O)